MKPPVPDEDPAAIVVDFLIALVQAVGVLLVVGSVAACAIVLVKNL